MKKIPNFVGRATKLRGNGVIEYCLWVDNEGRLYIQFEENDVDTTTRKPGTFKGLAYPVAKYAGYTRVRDAIPDPQGVNLESGKWEPGVDENNPGFLKAVLRHLIL